MGAVAMTTEQIVELALMAYRDRALWAEIQDRELESEQRNADARKLGVEDAYDAGAPLGPCKLPTLGMMVSDLVKRRYGPDENFEHLWLGLMIRLLARQTLGLPADLGFGLDIEE